MADKKFDYNHFIDVPRVDEILWNAGYFSGNCREGLGILSKPLYDLGFSQEDMRSGKFEESIHPYDLEVYMSLWERIKTGVADQIYCEYRLSNGRQGWNWIKTHGVVIERDHEKEITKVVGTDKNITSRKFAESYIRRELMDTKRKLDLSESIRLLGTRLVSPMELMENHESGLEQLRQIVEFDYCQILSHSERNRESKNELLISYPAEKPSLTGHEEIIQNLMDKQYPMIFDNTPNCAPYLSLLAVPLRFSGRYLGAVLLWHEKARFYGGKDLYPVKAYADILAVAVRNSRDYVQMRKGLESDLLTGFLTRKSFLLSAKDLWDKMKTSSRQAAVAMIDIDQFNQVNDDYGHAAGDRVLGRLSDLCRMKLRSDSLMGRYGGEEFVIIIPNCGEEDSYPIFERIKNSCESINHDGIDRPVTISIGLTIGRGAENPQEVIDRAEKALYKAKSEGYNNTAFLSQTPRG